MSTKAPTEVEGTELDDRTRRALTECMGIVPEGGELFTVVGENHPDRDQSEYTVDLRRGQCSCADSEYRNAECKHQRRVAFALGREPVPAAIAPSDVPGKLGGEHLEGEPRFLATDGGTNAVAGDTSNDQVADDSAERSRVPVAGGVLVYESRPIGKELVGFEAVDDWSDLRSALAARGLGVGAIHHKPVLDDSARQEPRRSEPADFGHGESTGVQEL